MAHAIEKLLNDGDRLHFPHASRVQGAVGLWELRPRRGRSACRAFYRRVADADETVVKVKDMPTFREVLGEALQNDEFRAEWERTALARAVAVAVAGYRAGRGLSQRALARDAALAVARLELGEHNPSVETLQRLSQALGIHFVIDLAPPGSQDRWVTPSASAAVREEFTAAAGGRVLIAAG